MALSGCQVARAADGGGEPLGGSWLRLHGPTAEGTLRVVGKEDKEFESYGRCPKAYWRPESLDGSLTPKAHLPSLSAINKDILDKA